MILNADMYVEVDILKSVLSSILKHSYNNISLSKNTDSIYLMAHKPQQLGITDYISAVRRSF